MSYDITISDEWINTTYNHSKMWRATTMGTVGTELGIWCIDGVDGSVAVGYLKAMHSYMLQHRETLLPLQPANGWGSYDIAVTVLNDLILLGLLFPNDKFNIS